MTLPAKNRAKEKPKLIIIHTDLQHYWPIAAEANACLIVPEAWGIEIDDYVLLMETDRADKFAMTDYETRAQRKNYNSHFTGNTAFGIVSYTRMSSETVGLAPGYMAVSLQEITFNKDILGWEESRDEIASELMRIRLYRKGWHDNTKKLELIRRMMEEAREYAYGFSLWSLKTRAERSIFQ
uniref:Uncharacterized protein n=1 Tax=Candidatus Kentrum sp. FM TaxID=2126340 RepID=A0A450S6H3_9GAMM|nr:MAG: hypothetical protein BECKFM1743A_GA0114220_1004716 [Candidatus Kentron sp. FM]VFJ47833.1 MAG: hypothetical protein BECKFM1743C_GA0114222_100515 [Candidatus Kentron sp. FM]VFK07866.1 MAG: hypothetical protein BECKFM1743B_GA0114221_1005215 [Candidatus Kentron sp. FM]